MKSIVEPFQLGEVIESCDAMLRLQAVNRGVTLTRRLEKRRWARWSPTAARCTRS
jgi:hypothetical protein